MRVQRPLVAEKVVAPDILKQLFPGQRDPTVFNKVEQQVVFLRRKIQFFIFNLHDPAGEIDRQIVDFDQLFFLALGRPLQDRVNAHHQLLR